MIEGFQKSRQLWGQRLEMSKDTFKGLERSIKAMTSEQKQAGQSVPADINELEPFLSSVPTSSFQDQSHRRDNLSG